MIDQACFRRTVSRFATGVTVVTARHDGKDYGMTLSAMTSLCLEPPMLLICVNRAIPTHDAIRDSGAFVANVLAESQQWLARQFARPADDKFASVATTPSEIGAPIIGGTLAHFVCRIADRMAGGTHSIFLGDVIEADAVDGRQPLLYNHTGFGRFDSPDVPKATTPAYVPPELADDPVAAGLTPAAFRLGPFYAGQ